MKKQLVSILMMTFMLVIFSSIKVEASGTYYVSSSGQDTNDGLTETTAFATISKAVETTDDQPTIIKLVDDISIGNTAIGTNQARDKSIVSQPTRDITIDLNGHKITNSQDGSIFCLWADGKLTINDFSPEKNGSIEVTGNQTRVIETFGDFTLREGTLKGNLSGKSGWPGGVIFAYPYSKTGIAGGMIKASCSSTNANGGAIYLDGYAYMKMSGGTIQNCNGFNGGAFYVSSNAKFEMISGKIIGNNAKYGGAIYNNGTTVLYIYSSYAQYGLSIMLSGNTADNNGGAIYNNGKLSITDATINNNRATLDGGAIYTTGTDRFDACKLNITGCSSTNGNGGAIYGETGSIVTLDASSIKNCTSNIDGGAIYTKGVLGLSSTNIEDNKVLQDGNGAGVCLTNGASMFIGETTIVKNNIKNDEPNKQNNTYVTRGSSLFFGTSADVNTPQEGMLVGVTADAELLEDGVFPVTENGQEDYISYLSSDDTKYIVKFDGTKMVLAVPSSGTKKYKAKDENKTSEKNSGSGKKGSKRTITPQEGRKVSSVVVTDKNGNKVDVTLNEDGTYSFIQPASDVTVEVNYKNREITLNIGSTEADVDGERENLDVCPVIRNDRTMLPIRFVAENLGAKVEWFEKIPDYVLITKGDTKIEITLGSNIMKVNGMDTLLDSVAFAENDRTYLPVRAVSEALNAIVEWNEEKPMEVKIFER